MNRARPLLATAFVLAVVAPSQAQTLPVAAEKAPADATAPAAVSVPALTPVILEILAPLGSNTSKAGETFAIRLVDPVVIDGKDVLPAGLSGMGEVVHAKKAGGSGAPGELVLAARYLEKDGVRVRLRSLNLSLVGVDRHKLVDRVSMAASVGGPVLSIVALVIKGQETAVPAGSLAQAKTAEAFVLAGGAPGPAAVQVEALKIQSNRE